MDNVLQAVVDAISESDNELAGQLITRLRAAHTWGQDDAQVLAASPTQLTSLDDFFDSSMVGMGIDVILPHSGTATGNEGSYLIASYVDEKNVTLTKINGDAAAFVDQSVVRWRFTTVKVETTLEFPTIDRLMQLYVGEEENAVSYAQLVQTPGAQEFRGLGEHTLLIDGVIDSSAPNTLDTISDFFTADYVGKALWVLKKSTATGNEGPHLITAYDAGTRSVTLSPGGFSVDETDVWFVIKTYSDSGYLTRDHRVNSEVIDGSLSYSDLQKLRRALLIDYAEGDELDRIGRNLAIARPKGFSDEIMRSLLKVLPYSAKGTMFCLESVLDALFPGQNWELYEDLINHPNTIYILLPLLEGDSDIFEGKGFLSPTGSDVSPPISSSGIGRGGREIQTATSQTTVSVTHTPISINDVILPIETAETEMDVLPSADTPSWTFNGVGGAGALEAQVFSVAATGAAENALQQTQPGGPTDVGGRYSKAIATDVWEGTVFEVSSFFRLMSYSASSGYAWSIVVNDTTINAEYGIFMNLSQAVLGGTAAVPVTSAVTLPEIFSANKWHHIRLRRETKNGVHCISAFIDGFILFEDIPASSFPATGVNTVEFGYEYQTGSTQNWTVQWDRVTTLFNSGRNYWNLERTDGAFSGTNNVLTATGFVAGDVGKRVRVLTVGTGGSAANRNVGLWQVSSYVSATQVILDGVLHENEVNVLTDTGLHYITADSPLFMPKDVGKQIDIIGSALGNSGARTVLEFVNPWKIRVDGVAFATELSLDIQFHPNTFVAATSVWWELVDAGSNSDKDLTLRESLPAADSVVHVDYTSVLSAQILKNSFVTNEGSNGTDDNIYYPFYVFDIDSVTRGILNSITAAGVIPEYERD